MNYKEKVDIEIQNVFYSINYNLQNGKWNCFYKEKQLIQNGFVEIDTREKIYASHDSSYHRDYKITKETDHLGSKQTLEITHYGSGENPEITVFLTLYDEYPIVSFKTRVKNTTLSELDILEISPLKTSYKENGCLFFGESNKCKVLQNVFWMDDYPNQLFPEKLTLSLDMQTQTRCWWNTAICNTINQAGFIIGILEPANNETAIVVGNAENDNNGIELKLTCGCYTDRGPGIYKEFGNKERRPLLLPKDRSFTTSEALFFIHENVLEGLEMYGEHLQKFNQIELWPHPVTGFFTAYSVDEFNKTWHNLDEENVNNITSFLAKTLLQYNLEYLKIELGLMGSPNVFNPYAVNSEFLTGYKLENYFPKGINRLVDGIHKYGFKAAWQSRTFLYVKGSENNEMEKTRDIYQKATNIWGFDYLMLDFNSWDAETYSQNRTLMEVIRDRFTQIKRCVNKNVFIEGCMNAWGPIFNSIHGYRPTSDYRAGLENILLKGFASRYYLHGKLFYNDAEFLDVTERPFPQQAGIGGGPEKVIDYSLEETIAWASLVGLTGYSLFAGGYLPKTSIERVEILRKLLPVYPRGARPVDLFEKDLPETWVLPVLKDFDKWLVVGLFNWDYKEPKKILFEFTKGGLLKNKEYLIFDFWKKQFIGKIKNSFSTILKPRNCIVLSIRENKEKPQLLSTTRHITQGGIEVSNIVWNDDKKILSGLSISPINSSHKLYFYIPESYIVRKINGLDSIEEVDQVLCATLVFQNERNIEWSIEFD